MNLGEPFVAAVQAAATSGEADGMVARGVVLEALAGAGHPR